MISELIKREEIIKGLELATMRTGVTGVVTVRASFFAGERFASENSQLALVCAQMLMLGTRKHNKEELNALLESAAISLNINSGTSRINILATLPTEQINKFISIFAEILREPTFSNLELGLLVARTRAEIIESTKDTDRQAARAMRRAIFPEGHPNFSPSEKEMLRDLDVLTVQNLKEFHQSYYGRGNFKIAVAGDVEHEEWKRMLNKAFASWSKVMPIIKLDTRSLKSERGINYVYIADKTSVDAYLGMAITLDVRGREYCALMLATHILGGDFVSRLMSEVREKRGLTYGTNATMRDISEGDSGLFFIWGTFAPNLFSQGFKITKEILNKFAKRGITKNELTRAKRAIPGNFKVSLANSAGVAGTLLYILETARPTNYIDEYPKIIESLTLTEVNSAIKKYIDPTKSITTVAGTITENVSP